MYQEKIEGQSLLGFTGLNGCRNEDNVCHTLAPSGIITKESRCSLANQSATLSFPQRFPLHREIRDVGRCDISGDL